MRRPISPSVPRSPEGYQLTVCRAVSWMRYSPHWKGMHVLCLYCWACYYVQAALDRPRQTELF